MPIKGLNANLSVPVAGHFRLGRMVESKTPGVLRPEATDFFVYRPTALLSRLERAREEARMHGDTVEGRAAQEEVRGLELEVKAAVDRFAEVHGAEPRRLEVNFVSESLEQTFSHWLQLWGGRRLLCKGDGELVAWRSIEEDSGVDEEGRMVCPGPDVCPLSTSRANRDGVPGCGPSGSLRFTVPDLAGIHSLELGSWRAVRRTLAGLEALRGSVGGLCGYPVVLALRPEQQKGRDGKTRTVQVVDMVPGVAISNAKVMCVVGGALSGAGRIPANVAIVEEGEEEAAEPVDPDFLIPEEGERQPAWWEVDEELQEALRGVAGLKRAAILKAVEAGTLDRAAAMKAAGGKK